MGPDNYLARFYQQTPIGITVEGANILTRTLMIFGQGAIRSHPYVLKEIAATTDENRQRALKNFDEAVFAHISFALSNAARSFVFGISQGYGMPIDAAPEVKRYYQQLTRYSAAFALSSDIAMAVLGGSLKRREKISARLGDVLSLMYLCSATLKRFADEGRPAEDLPLLHWSMQDALYKIEQAFAGVMQNFPNVIARFVLRTLIFPIGQRLAPPSDALGHQVASLLMQPSAARDRLTAGMYLGGTDEQDAVCALEAALLSTLACEPVQALIEQARKAKTIKSLGELAGITEAREAGIISAEQALQLERDYALRRKVIMVDDFAPEELRVKK